MRKDFCLLMVLMFIFSTITPVFAQVEVCTETEKWNCVACPDCDKCDDWHIPTGIPAGTGQDADPGVPSEPFDWDEPEGYCEMLPAYGGVATAATGRNCRLILNACECDQCEFEQGWVFGVELKILTSGVYWANDANVPNNGIDEIAADDAVEPDQDGNFNTRENCNEAEYNLGFRLFEHDSTSKTQCDDDTGPNEHTFRVSYFTSTNAWVDEPGDDGDNKAIYMRTPTPYDGYELTAEDAYYRKCLFYIDMPKMIATNAQAGAMVQVQARLLFTEPLSQNLDPGCDNPNYVRPDALEDPPSCQEAIGTNHPDIDNTVFVDADDFACDWAWKLCPDCGCGCIKDVGIIGCKEEETEPCTDCIMFPYVLAGISGWNTGLGITRLCDPCDDATPTMTLTLTDTAGDTFTYTVNDANNFTDLIDEIEWVEGTPAAGPGWVSVSANSNIDGMLLIISDDGYAGAVMARGCFVCPE